MVSGWSPANGTIRRHSVNPLRRMSRRSVGRSGAARRSASVGWNHRKLFAAEEVAHSAHDASAISFAALLEHAIELPSFWVRHDGTS